MTHTKAKAESAQSSYNAASALESLESVWPMAVTGMSVPTAIESIRRLSEFQMEVARFTAERARKSAGTLAAFTTCRAPGDFLGVWRKAAIDTVTDYADETARIFERSQK